MQDPTRPAPFLGEVKPLYRADTDQGGHWYVWRRLSANGWATYRKCETREAAMQLATELNAKSDQDATP